MIIRTGWSIVKDGLRLVSVGVDSNQPVLWSAAVTGIDNKHMYGIMRIMRANWVAILILTVFVLTLGITGVEGCHTDELHDASSCWGHCSHVGAVVVLCPAVELNFSLDRQLALADHMLMIPHRAPSSVFQPPKASA